MTKYGEWIEIKWRELTEEEKEYYGNGITAISESELPECGQEVLISQHNGRWMSVVRYDDDDFVGDDQGNDWITDVDAWMPLPKGFVKEQSR